MCIPAGLDIQIDTKAVLTSLTVVLRSGVLSVEDIICQNYITTVAWLTQTWAAQRPVRSPDEVYVFADVCNDQNTFSYTFLCPRTNIKPQLNTTCYFMKR